MSGVRTLGRPFARCQGAQAPAVGAVEIVAALPNDRKFNPALSLTKTVAVPLALACYPAKLFTAQL